MYILIVFGRLTSKTFTALHHITGILSASKERAAYECTDCGRFHLKETVERSHGETLYGITFFIQVLLNLAWPYFHSSIAHLIICTTLFWFKYRSLRMVLIASATAVTSRNLKVQLPKVSVTVGLNISVNLFFTPKVKYTQSPLIKNGDRWPTLGVS